MIVRRGLLASGIARLAIGQAHAAVPPELRFNVMRNGSPIGQHNIRFSLDGETLRAAVVVEIVVRLGPIALYRYTHSVREVWRGGRFESLESETNDDGKPFRVRAVRGSEGVVIESSVRTVLPPNAIPLTHWNSLCMERKLFNPQDGLPIDSTIVSRGDESVALADGRTVRATHYSLVGKVALDDWYDGDHMWTALRSTGTDGSTIEYRRAV
jgi:hypothetical protein